jgi:hypothetical protein
MVHWPLRFGGAHLQPMERASIAKQFYGIQCECTQWIKSVYVCGPAKPWVRRACAFPGPEAADPGSCMARGMEMWPMSIKRARSLYGQSCTARRGRWELPCVVRTHRALWAFKCAHHCFSRHFFMHVQFGPPPYYVYRFGLEGEECGLCCHNLANNDCFANCWPLAFVREPLVRVRLRGTTQSKQAIISNADGKSSLPTTDEFIVNYILVVQLILDEWNGSLNGKCYLLLAVWSRSDD